MSPKIMEKLGQTLVKMSEHIKSLEERVETLESEVLELRAFKIKHSREN